MTVPILQKERIQRQVIGPYRKSHHIETTLDFKPKPWDLGDSYEWGSSVEGETPPVVWVWLKDGKNRSLTTWGGGG